MGPSIQEVLQNWLEQSTKMALYYGNIAYGKISDESEIFQKIHDIWNDDGYVEPSKNSESICFQNKHIMTCQNISLLC